MKVVVMVMMVVVMLIVMMLVVLIVMVIMMKIIMGSIVISCGTLSLIVMIMGLMMTRKTMVINHDHDHDYEDHDDSSKDYNGQQKRAEPDNDDEEYDYDDGCGGDYDDGQHSGQQGQAEPASKISSVSSAAACIPTPCFQTHKTAGLSSTAGSSSFVAIIIIIIIISLGCIITSLFSDSHNQQLWSNMDNEYKIVLGGSFHMLKAFCLLRTLSMQEQIQHNQA